MNQPMAYLHGIQYREAAVYLDGGRATSTDVIRVHFRTHEGEMDQFDFPNGSWDLGNSGLQFMALYGYQPTDLPEDGALLDTSDDDVLVPIAPDPYDGGWGLAQNAMSGGREALEEAEWFDPEVEIESTGDAHSAPQAPPGPDPGTGNRGGVEMEQADADSDQGVTVKVE
jgi:hypothetical protein